MPYGFDPTSPAVLLMAGLACLIVTVLLRRRRGIPARTATPVATPAPAARRATASAHQGLALAKAPAELTRWEVEMHELARELTARLDSKMSAIEHLTRLAAYESSRLEEAIARAENLQLDVSPTARHAGEALADQASANGRSDAEMAPPRTPWTTLSPEPASSTARVHRLIDPPERLTGTRSSGDAALRGNEQAAHTAHLPAVDRSQAVYRLRDAGLEASRIAAELSCPVGEVDLILSLRGPRTRLGTARP